jgi:hypothetical protein
MYLVKIRIEGGETKIKNDNERQQKTTNLIARVTFAHLPYSTANKSTISIANSTNTSIFANNHVNSTSAPPLNQEQKDREAAARKTQ